MKAKIISVCLIMMLVACGQNKKGQPTNLKTTSKELSATEYGSDTGKNRIILYESENLKVFVERNDSMWEGCCYVSVDDIEKKLDFGNEYLDSGSADFSVYAYDQNLFIVGDINPNSNGWTNRFLLYKMKRKDLKPIFIDAGAAINFRKEEIVIAKARLTNPDAGSTIDERWLMHDVHYDTDGRLCKEDRREYDYQEMTGRFGDKLINTMNRTENSNEDKNLPEVDEITEKDIMDGWMFTCPWAEWEGGDGRYTVLYPAFMKMNREWMNGRHECLRVECERLTFTVIRYRDKMPVTEKYEALKSGAITSSVDNRSFLLAGKVYDDMRFFEKHIKTENHWCYLRVEFPVSLTAAIEPLLQYVKEYQLTESIMR